MSLCQTSGTAVPSPPWCQRGRAPWGGGGPKEGVTREGVAPGRGWPEDGVTRGGDGPGRGWPRGGGGPGTWLSLSRCCRTGRVRLEEGASLRLDLLRAEDQGWYECRVLFLDRHSTDADFQNGTWIHLTVNGTSPSHPHPLCPHLPGLALGFHNHLSQIRG